MSFEGLSFEGHVITKQGVESVLLKYVEEMVIKVDPPKEKSWVEKAPEQLWLQAVKECGMQVFQKEELHKAKTAQAGPSNNMSLFEEYQQCRYIDILVPDTSDTKNICYEIIRIDILKTKQKLPKAKIVSDTWARSAIKDSLVRAIARKYITCREEYNLQHQEHLQHLHQHLHQAQYGQPV